MKYLSLALMLAAAPAYAHHEVVMATSILPTLGGLTFVIAAGLVALRKKLRAGSAKRNKVET